LGLFTSDNESFCLSILEAMCFGCPSVATSVGGIPEVVDHDTTGMLIPFGDADAIARAMEGLIQNPARRKEMGIAAQRVARSASARTSSCRNMNRCIGGYVAESAARRLSGIQERVGVVLVVSFHAGEIFFRSEFVELRPRRLSGCLRAQLDRLSPMITSLAGMINTDFISKVFDPDCAVIRVGLQ